MSYELLRQLAAVLAESPDLTHADATYRLRNAFGLLAFDDRTEATRVSAAFRARGVPTLLLPELISPAEARPLNRERPELGGDIELAIAGRLQLETRRVTWDFSLLRTRVAYPRVVVPGSGIEEHASQTSETRFRIDLFTATAHWRAHAGSLRSLDRVVDLVRGSAALLSTGMSSLLNGTRRLPTFHTEDDYERYVTWLYQLRYAARDE